MKLLDVFALSGLINGLFTLGLGIFVIFHNWREKLNRLYFLIVLATGLWSFSYWLWLSSPDAINALFWVRILSIGSILIPVFYFHWTSALLKIEHLQRTAIILVYILGILFVLFSFTNLFITGLEQKLFFPFWPNPGVLYHFYVFVLYICLVIYSGNLLIKNYREASGENKKRLAYVLGGAILAFGGGLSNFFLWYDIPIAPYGNFLIAFYPLLFGYATIKYRLFNVRIVATELFVIAIWIFLFIKILISNSPNDLIVNIILFLTVIFFGILLIRSVFKEVKQREQIEKMADDIKKAYESEKKAYEIEKNAKEKLEDLDNLKNQFLLAIQHHLRTPLTAMIGYSDLLLNGIYGKQPKKTIEVANKFKISAKRLVKMVNEFLDITQFQMGKGAISLKSGIDVSLIIGEIAEELKFETEKKGIYLKLEKPSQLFLIKADREKLKAALYNIIDNSVKYTTEGGVKIKIESNDFLKIIIQDTGIGISKDHLSDLFGKTFERGKEAQKTFTTGRGIGLYISSQIIKAHNGKIWADSEGEGSGSTFIIELPFESRPK